MTDQLPEPLTPLQAARVSRDRLALALATAQSRAVLTERQRAEAEEAHASTVADALCSGQKTPVKPATLSALQSADDAADAALAIIEARLATASGEVQSLAHEAALAVVRSHAERAVAMAHDGRHQVVAGFARLVAGAGVAHARLIAEDILSWNQWPDDTRQRAVAAVRDEVPELASVAGLASSIFDEAATRMPRFVHHDPEGFAALVAQIKKEI